MREAPCFFSGGGRERKGMGQNSDSSDGASDSQDAADDNQESENTDSQDGEEPEKPDGNGQSAEAEEISLSDIQEGDIVSITLDEDGNAAFITVMSMEMVAGLVACQASAGLMASLRVWTVIRQQMSIQKIQLYQMRQLSQQELTRMQH